MKLRLVGQLIRTLGARRYLVLGVLIGAATALDFRVAILLGLATLVGVILLALGVSRLVTLLIATTFVTVVRINMLGVHLRLEHFVLLLCAAALVRSGRLGAMAEAARDRTVLLFGAFVAWSGLVSLIRPPQRGQSLLIVGWLALDWLLLIVLVAATPAASRLARTGSVLAAAASVLAAAMWLSSRVLGTSAGVTPKIVAGIPAASGVSYEANLLGATMALWAFVAITSLPGRAALRTGVLVVPMLVAVALSYTRAAFVGLAGGLIVWGVIGGGRPARRVGWLFAGTVMAALPFVALAPGVTTPITTTVSKALDFGSGTGRQRAQGWSAAIHDLKGFDWAVGLGTNSFGQRHLDPTFPTRPTPAYLANLPLQVLYDTGVVGVVLLAFAVASLLTRERLQDGRAVGLAVVYVACASATSPFWYGTTWILVAIGLIDRRRLEQSGSGAVLPTLREAARG